MASSSRQPPPADITAEWPGEEEEQCRDITEEEEDIMVGDDMEEDIGRDMDIDNSSNKNSPTNPTRRTLPGST